MMVSWGLARIPYTERYREGRGSQALILLRPNPVSTNCRNASGRPTLPPD